MTLDIQGFAASSPTSPLAPCQFQRREPRENDVLIEILYCGICHSDLHNIHNDWGGAHYPMVPGHEIIGKVLTVGTKVTKFKAGDRVGVGCMVDSCQKCNNCQQNLEQYCENKSTLTYNDIDRHDQMRTFGGYSEKIVVAENFVLKIPENLDLAGAAPLLCAGITMWSPLRYWQVTEGTRIAIVGLGGLGHMALKLAKALQANVTLFSRSPQKKKDAHRLGADHIIISTDQNQMNAAKNSFDLILDTVPYAHNLNPYLPTLTLNGTLVLLGFLGNQEPALNTVPLILGHKSVAGSVIGGIKETQELLDFCGKQQITSDVELIKIQDVNHAYERMIKSDVKYRFVIDMASLRDN